MATVMGWLARLALSVRSARCMMSAGRRVACPALHDERRGVLWRACRRICGGLFANSARGPLRLAMP